MKRSLFHLSSSSSLLGISFGAGAMTAAVVKESGGQPHIVKSCRTDMAIDLLSGAPELAAQEIRTRLTEAGIRAKRCVVCIPLKWTLTMQTALPELSEEEQESFVQLQAERSLPFAPQDLMLSQSRYRFGDEGQCVTVAALPVNRLATLENVLRAAGLHPVSITFGISSVVGDADATDSIALLVDENSVELEIRAGSGAAALRSLEEAIDTSGEGSRYDADMIARQLRITLGNMPPAFRNSVSTVRIFGPDHLCRALAQELGDAVRPLGLSVVVPVPGKGANFAPGAEGGAPPTAAALAAARRLAGRAPEFEFLPPRLTQAQRLAQMVAGRGIVRLAAAAGALVGVVALVFLVEYLRLAHYEGKWKALEPKYMEGQTLQANLRQYRSWFQSTPRSLAILNRLTDAFPPDGAAWVTKLEINGVTGTVTCTVNARTSGDSQKVVEKLIATRGITAVHQTQPASQQFQVTYIVTYIDTMGEGNAN